MHQTSAMLTDAIGALLVRGLGIGLMFVSTTIAARLLGADEFGTFSSALSLAMLLATIAPIGTDRIVARNLSTTESDAESEREIALTLASTIAGACVLTLIILPVTLLTAFFNQNTEWTRVLLLAGGLFVPLSFIYVRQWVALPLAGTRRALMPEQTLLPLAFSISLLGCSWLRIKPNAIATVLLYLASMVIVLTVTTQARAMRPLLNPVLTQLRAIRSGLVRQRMREGLPFLLISVGAVACQASIPITLAATVGFRGTACFMLAVPYAALPSLTLGIMNLSLLPQLRRHYRNHEMSQAGHCVRSAATLTFYAATMVSTIIWWSTPVVVTILGQDYVAVAGLLLPLLLAAMVDCLTGPTVPVMQTMGLEAFYTRAMLCYLPVQICLMAAAGTLSGIQGAAFAFLTARVLWNIAIAVHIYRVQGLCMLPYINVMNAFWPSAEAASKETIAVTITATSTSNSIAYNTSARAA